MPSSLLKKGPFMQKQQHMEGSKALRELQLQIFIWVPRIMIMYKILVFYAIIQRPGSIRAHEDSI